MKEQRLKTILQRHTKLKTKNTEDPLTWSIIRMTTPWGEIVSIKNMYYEVMVILIL